MPLISTFPLALSLPAAAAVGYWLGHSGRGPSLRGSVLKTGAVAGLAVLGAMAGAPGMIVAGLALGSLGDLALSRPGRPAFLAGMAAFALGHLAYVAAFWGSVIWGQFSWAAVPFLALVVSTEVWLAPQTGALRWPVRGYVAVIAALGLAALHLPPGMGMVQAGVTLFVLSDALLALELFVLPARGAPVPRVLLLTVWAAYWGGQALILLGSLAVPLAFHPAP
jgi:uncharacterized membrane protein YhhN